MIARASLADFDNVPVPSPIASLADFAAPAANDAGRPALVRQLGELLNQPLGLFTGTPFAKYVAAEGTNASRLKDLAHSPLLYQHRLTVPRAETAPMRLGTCAHTAVLEPHKLLSEYVLWDERTEDDKEKVSPRRGKKWDAFLLANHGKKIVRADELAAAMAMRDAVRGKAAAMKYLRAGDPEVAMWWADGTTERLCKGRADWVTKVEGAPVIVGLKTTDDCRGVPFGIKAAKLGYALQWAFYCDGYRAITGETPRVVEIVVESDAPHDVVVYAISDAVLEAGRTEYARLLALLGRCEKANTWPGSAAEEQALTLPGWAVGASAEVVAEA